MAQLHRLYLQEANKPLKIEYTQHFIKKKQDQEKQKKSKEPEKIIKNYFKNFVKIYNKDQSIYKKKN